jgi:hypothetical protein
MRILIDPDLRNGPIDFQRCVRRKVSKHEPAGEVNGVCAFDVDDAELF